MAALRIVAIVFGFLLALAAALAFVFDILALIDPVGAKAADDNDPFGPPPSRPYIARQAVATLAVGAVGIWLAVHHARKLTLPLQPTPLSWDGWAGRNHARRDGADERNPL